MTLKHVSDIIKDTVLDITEQQRAMVSVPAEVLVTIERHPANRCRDLLAEDAERYRRALKWTLSHHREDRLYLWLDDDGRAVLPPDDIAMILEIIEREIDLDAEHAG